MILRLELRREDVFGRVEVLAAICARTSESVVADQSVLVGGGVVVADLIEDGAFVEFGKVSLKVEVAEILYVGGVFGSPSVLDQLLSLSL